jgi:uncharacterized membrane protein HdeD (DUF308 family)
VVDKGLRKISITVSKPALAILCIIFGIVVLVWRDLLNIVVGIFLLIQGILLLTDYLELRSQQQSSPG